MTTYDLLIAKGEAKVSAEGRYEYDLWGSGVKSVIKFKNTEANGIGVPLPKGVIKVYKQDSDENMEFIGEDSIDHTGRNEEVKITTGKAFDIVASTLSKDRAYISDRVSERTVQVTIRNNSDEEKTGAILTAPSPSLSLIISLILSSVFSDTRRGKRTLMYSLLSADSALISII